MSIRIDDIKERALSMMKEFKGQRMGMIGFSIIIFLLAISLLSPWLAPDTDGQWANPGRWEDNPRSAAPNWADYILPGTRAPHDIREDYDELDRTFMTIKYVYENEYDYPPSDITVFVSGTSSESRIRLYIDLIRPDGENILFVDESVSITNGTFSYRFSLRSSAGRDRSYDFGLNAHRDFFPDDLTPPDRESVNIQMVPFAKLNENILLDPESLKGTYTLEVEAVGIDEYDDEGTRVLFRGMKYGLMGTDSNRKNLALGWVHGAKYALIIGGIVSLSSISIALIYGMTSAYYGGWVDEIMQRANEILLGIPIFPILVITMYAIGRSIWILVLIYVILGWRGLAKIIRARGIQIRQDTYVEAAQSLGSSGGRVITRHMIPQLLPYAIAEGALMIPMVVIAEAGLSVLGLADPTVVTWGRMLSEANQYHATISGLWWWILLPGLGLTLLGFGFITTGMALERVVNPKMRQR